MEQRIVVSGKELVRVARITSPVGVNGGVKSAPVFFNTKELGELFSVCAEGLFLIRGSQFPKKMSVASLKVSEKYVDMKFKEAGTRNDAIKLCETDVYVPYDVYLKYLKDTKSIFGYVGYSVVDKKLGALGEVTEVVRDKQTFLVVGVKLIPFVKELVESVDYERKLIKTILPEGIFE
ncbi:MAG: hypothetical protein V1647_06490 [Pseudomonadota bacterium]